MRFNPLKSIAMVLSLFSNTKELFIRNAREFTLLFGLIIFCLALSATRIVATDRITYIFLVWNLFLAIIPYMIGLIFSMNFQLGRVQKLGLILMWVVFFPNAPYILTDLFHLRLKTTAPIWFDTVLISAYAWAGLTLAFLSLEKMKKALLSNWGLISRTLLTVSFLFITAFGIYVGRYLRWNSWDLVSSPFMIGEDLLTRITSPMDHPRTWGMTLLLGILLNLMYYSFKLMRARK